MSLDPFDAVAVAEAVASGEPERFAAGVRALAEAVRQGDAYDVPLPDRAALPGLLASGDPDAAEALLSLLESYGAFLPPAMPDDLWAWGGPLLVRLGHVRLGLRLAIGVRTSADPSAALGAVLTAADTTPGPWVAEGLDTFFDTLSTAAGSLPGYARAELARRAADPRWAPFAAVAGGAR
jgi:hypothetical protein